MPNQQAADNGLSTFSLHTFDESSSRTIAQLQEEHAASPGVRPEGLESERDLDPEMAARRYLGQALASDVVPSFNAPVANGVTSRFKTIGTETIPLTDTCTVKFRQTLNDIPVYGSLVTVELDKANGLVGIDSALGEPQGVDPVATVSPGAALAAADAAPDGYALDLAGVVPRLNHYFDAAASHWRLVYILQDVPVTLDRTAEPRSDQQSELEPPRFVDYVVDAHDRHVVAILPRTPSMTAGEEQTATDSFDVKRTFLTSRRGANLEMNDPLHNVQTFDFDFGDPSVDHDQLPGRIITNPPPWSPGAVSAHANAIAVSEFLRTVLRRDNIDGRGGPMRSTINCVVADSSPGPNQWINAFWDGQQMVYGQVLRPGDELRSLSANIDVVAHEMFHGVTDHTSRLEYAFQSGALNESYSDIFGTIVANAGNEDSRTWNWLLGENLLPGDRPFRDLSDPPRFGQSAHTNQFRVLPNTRAGDWGGVHVNSGIHNKAAFHMFTAQADDGTLKLSPAEVAAIFYLALTQRLSRTSQFTDSRRAVVASARTLFRALPAEQRADKVAAVEAAFDAVGIL
ncbi:M4 family metallopeptidase [Streptomyces sp. NBC_01381]|uniref:M4 family metallopeptidase n=1 Tax=Streptomyces sp. NBC_01381 TaxID=2903845 RepID=UPI002259E22E|nr:M4 family metallopeptidase [Streptomyces sp. NBC_01381]MCX4672351.1 M4 family metallopeptidase [Streptomyces sp. NBC_01381]